MEGEAGRVTTSLNPFCAALQARRPRNPLSVVRQAYDEGFPERWGVRGREDRREAGMEGSGREKKKREREREIREGRQQKWN